MRARSFYLASLLSIIFCAASTLTQAQNFVAIGGEQAPIKYIHGAGSNIGLYVGVEYKPEGTALGKAKRGEIGVGRFFRGAGRKGVGQGFWKQAVSNSETNGKHSFATPAFSRIPNKASMNILRRPHFTSSIIAQDIPQFQLNPVFDYNIESDTVTEILLPLLCQDLYLDVPPSDPDENFNTFTASDTVSQTYVGIYRTDKYINENVISKVLFNGQSIAFAQGSLSPIELQMILYCHIEVDSSSFGRVLPGYYDIRHAHLSPGLANFPVWAARHNQDTTACKEGISHLNPNASREFVEAIFYLNHIAFLMAKMEDFKNRFPGPGGPAPQVPNLEPYAFIQWNPKRFESQNSANGVVFSGEYSFDPDGKIDSYLWDFGNGDTSTEINPTYKFRANGNYQVILTVQDNVGAVSRDTVLVRIATVGLNDREKNSPQEFVLQQNSPNPFRASTAITFEILRSEVVKVQIYDLAGREVMLLTNAPMEQGRHQILWNGKDQNGNEAPAGLYFYRLTTPLFSQVKRMVLLR